ncbi:MAG: hypothetical protein K9N49_05630 [Candidatus Marinimicrobia bacterium]|nr:hypothetical protein [Candidatus Neomarinimicrobiota bacterium]
MNDRPGFWQRPVTAFAVLVALHFAVDFYAGLLTPLPEPTLTRHLHTNIGRIALLIGGWALLVNAVQPLSGGLLPGRGWPLLLILGAPAAALTTLIGLTTSWWGVGALLALSGCGIGMLHPEAALAVHGLGGRRAGAAVGLFMSMGYFGVACGGIVGGLWAERWQLQGFWLLALPALALGWAAWRARVHCVPHAIITAPAAGAAAAGPSFRLVLGTAIGVAVFMTLVLRFTTPLLVRRFPEAAAQGWGGAAVFATGLTGALGACGWGALADRLGPARILPWLCLAALPFLVLLLGVTNPAWAPVWALGLGATVGSAFPLIVVQAGHARGGSHRLRLGLIIGGAWGLGESAFMFGGQFVNRYPPQDDRPVTWILALCGLLLPSTAALAWRGRQPPATPSTPQG